MIKAQTLKGFRDFLPKDAKKREYVINALKKVFESYGFEPLETPSLEYEEILAGKYGTEGDKLMYKFEDNGKRKIALRYDQTVPLARVVAEYQNDLPMPFKRYQIQNVWRAENTQKGRYREFMQCDIDTVGSPSLSADAEIISCALETVRKLGFKNVKVLVNDRSVFYFKTSFDISSDKISFVIRTIDKLKKIGDDGVLSELKKGGFAKEEAEEILNGIKNIKETNSISNIRTLLKDAGVDESLIEFSPSLARGLDYYTGIIFEIVSEDYPYGSVAGGGRYDNLIGVFSGKQIPAVGISFGFDRVIEAMDELNLFPAGLSVTKVLITNTNEKKALEVGKTLRENNINTEIYLEEKDLEKQLKYADKKDIPFAIIFDKDKLILKDMIRRTQETLTIEEILTELKKP
ncbi:MAG: histidine--tRNA ligase [Patescibacteria group bacterium]|nr:histidine--tRNA ligase [Patescibacteria group bacterium]